MILAEDEVRSAPTTTGSWSSRTTACARDAAADVLPIADRRARARDHPQPPRLPRRLRRRARGPRRHRRAAEPPPWSDDPGSAGDARGLEITVECPDLCPRFTARVFENVKIGPSPRWLKARLMAAGQRPISNVVDITNYVMLLTGQPMHAFDLDRVAGPSLTVRRARDGEPVADARRPDPHARRRDGADRRRRGPDLDRRRDGRRALRGRATATTRVLMEVATWNGANIHRTVAQARLAHRGLEPLREAASARAGDARRRRSPPS